MGLQCCLYSECSFEANLVIGFVSFSVLTISCSPASLRCVLEQDINSSLVLVQPRKTHPNITERLLMRGKESNQTLVASCSDWGLFNV